MEKYEDFAYALQSFFQDYLAKECGVSGNTIRSYRDTFVRFLETKPILFVGFKELVKHNVTHRDLKPANILMHEGVFKIADFGFAKYVDYSSA